MASNNSVTLAASEILPVNLASGSEMTNLSYLEQLAHLPVVLWENREFLFLELRIIFTAMACIYIGSYGSLRRPPSANPPKKDKKGGARGQDEDRDDQYVQGLLPSDAIMFPVLAGIVLVGLYYLIKWLEDPDILNKILRVYFSSMSLASMGKLFADALHLLTGFIFPTVWRSKDGKLFHIDTSRRSQWSESSDTAAQVWDNNKKTPFGGRLSEWKLSEKTMTLLWEIRHLLSEQWTVRLSIHGIANETFKVKFNDILGVVLAIGANVVYYMTESTLLSNIMGYAFSYAGIIMMSPTTFTTGTSVLSGLFFYDIFMVFYTPYMVTVATQLDVPIKLVFDGPTKSSMLGLGDIVLPGIFVGLSLRFDHYMYYYRQRKLVPVELKTETDGLVTNEKTQNMVVKPDYVNPQGQWGDWFWSTRLGKILSPDATPALKASAFPKPYFYACMIGYFLAMVTTLVMLLVYQHAQPALLYLVPGVTLAVGIKGLVRGELREMWAYTEDGSLDTQDTIVEVDQDGNVFDVVKEDDKKKKKEAKADVLSDVNPAETDVSSKKIDGQVDKSIPGLEESKKGKRYPVFLFSIEAPAPVDVKGS
ncbi:signal peptide peptidase-domain-containing protein [Hypomontagnella submonticulosa]|nr:signal peptide peptidase-domain-containing protein [Hypomontagnella submonticulosa]